MSNVIESKKTKQCQEKLYIEICFHVFEFELFSDFLNPAHSPQTSLILAK